MSFGAASVDDEAACLALTEGTTRDEVALMLGYAIWAVAARYEYPHTLNPGDLPSSGTELPFETEPQAELGPLDDLFCLCDSSW